MAKGEVVLESVVVALLKPSSYKSTTTPGRYVTSCRCLTNAGPQSRVGVVIVCHLWKQHVDTVLTALSIITGQRRHWEF